MYRLEPVSGVGCSRLKYPNRQPLGITGPKGHLRKDLDELSRSTSRSIKVHFIFVVGGSQMTSKVHFFAETRLRRSQNDHSHATPWYELVVFSENSSDLGHYFWAPHRRRKVSSEGQSPPLTPARASRRFFGPNSSLNE